MKTIRRSKKQRFRSMPGPPPPFAEWWLDTEGHRLFIEEMTGHLLRRHEPLRRDKTFIGLGKE